MLPIASLITKMTKREKFYFRKNHPDSENKAFMLLYDYIDKHPHATNDDIKLHFKDSAFLKSIHVELNSLYQKLLRTLKVYRINSKDPEYVIQKNLSFVLILIEKDELDQALKLLKRTKKIAYRYEEFAFLIKIISVEEKLRFSFVSSNMDIFEEINNERLQVINELQQITSLKYIKSQLLEILYYTAPIAVDEEELSFVYDYEFFKRDTYTSSNIGAEIFYLCKSLYNNILGDTKKALFFSQESKKVVYDNPHIFSINEKLRMLNNLLNDLIDMSEYDAFLATYNEFKSFEDHEGVNKSYFTYIDSYIRLKMEIKMDNIDKIKSLLQETIPKIENKKVKLSATQRGVMFFHFIYGYITIGDFNSALDYINKWDTYQVEKFNSCKRKVFRLIVFYELKKYRLLDSEVKAYEKLIIRKDEQNELSSFLIKYFKLIVKNPDKRSEIEKSLVGSLTKLHQNKDLKRCFQEIKFINWANKSTSN